MMKNNKAQSLTVLGSIIIATLVVILLGFVFIPSLFSSSISENVECSIGLNDLVDGDGILDPRTIRFIEVKCEPVEVEISTGEEKRATDLLSQCWNKFGAGNLNLLPKDEHNTACIYCGSLLAKNDITLDSRVDNSLFTSRHFNLNNLQEEESSILPETLSSGERLDMFFVTETNPVNDGLDLLFIFSHAPEERTFYDNTASGVFVTQSQSDSLTNAEFLRFNVKDQTVVCNNVIVPN